MVGQQARRWPGRMNPTSNSCHVERGQERRAIRRFTDVERHTANNLEAATIIGSDPVKYAGALLIWARLVLDRQSKLEHVQICSEAA